MFWQKLKKFRYLCESFVVGFGLWFFGLFSVKFSSNISAKIAKFVGKFIAVNKLALNNLTLAMPELDFNARKKIIEQMWENLGRIVGEFVYICKSTPQDLMKNVEITEDSLKNIEDLKNSNNGAIVFSGHIGNWELGPKTLIAKGLKINVVYRPLNNPLVEEMTAKIRGVNLIEKGVNGTRKIIEALKNKELVIILADQKVSEGEKIKFFNDEAITTTSIARLALKYDVPLVPARVVRLGNNFLFRVDIEKNLVFKKSNDLNCDITNLTLLINLKLEQWIKEYPSQWFWVHNRWKK